MTKLTVRKTFIIMLQNIATSNKCLKCSFKLLIQRILKKYTTQKY